MWRNNFTSIYQNANVSITGKIAFKVKEKHWIGTQSRVVLLISIHSAFHDDYQGELKMNAFVETIKKTVKGPITVLFTEKAHVQTLALRYQNNYQMAFSQSLSDARNLATRYQSYFNSCRITYWHEYIEQDPSYSESTQKVQELYKNDSLFQHYLSLDAVSAYTEKRMQEFPDKDLFIEKTIADLLEQCTGLLVLANKGYRFQFYPGSSNLSVEYANRHLIPKNNQISWINVNLSIEKKIKSTNFLPQSLLSHEHGT